ncbi:MAG: protein translocase subunit SecF [Lachnospirales bacterium]
MKIIRHRKKFFIASLGIIIIGIVVMLANLARGVGLFNYDVEFAGGVSITLDVGQDFEVTDIEKIIADTTEDTSPQIQKIISEPSDEYLKYLENPEAFIVEEEPTEEIANEEAANETTDESTEEVVDETQDNSSIPSEEPSEEVTENTDAIETEATVDESGAVEIDPTATEEEAKPKIVKPVSPYRVSIKIKEIDNEKRQALVAGLTEKYELTSNDIEMSYVSGTISSEMRTSAALAMILASVLMLLYVSFRFSDLSMGASAIIALVHDAIMVILVYGIFRLPLNYYFIVAVLTILGYSINSTIVIFDRVRENKGLKKLGQDELIDLSVSQSLRRSLFTSITTLLPIICLLIFGVTSIREFAIPLAVGILVGTYSSVCLSGSIWYTISEAKKKKRNTTKKK